MKYYISKIDLEVNEGRNICLDIALNRIQKYIIKNIDPTFPTDEFKEWCDSDTDKPFRWNKNSYHWT